MRSLQLNLKEFENTISSANKVFMEKGTIISSSLKEAAKVFIKEIQEN